MLIRSDVLFQLAQQVADFREVIAEKNGQWIDRGGRDQLLNLEMEILVLCDALDIRMPPRLPPALWTVCYPTRLQVTYHAQPYSYGGGSQCVMVWVDLVEWQRGMEVLERSLRIRAEHAARDQETKGSPRRSA